MPDALAHPMGVGVRSSGGAGPNSRMSTPTPDTLLFLAGNSVVGAKVWTPTGEGGAPEASDYGSNTGPFTCVRAVVHTLTDLEQVLRACPFNAFHVRGMPATPDATTLPYRRTLTHGLEPPSLIATAHRVVPIDFDEKNDAAPPMRDLRGTSEQVRALLPPPFNELPCIAAATSSSGIKPGARVRLWYLLDEPVTDAYLKERFSGVPNVDRSIYQGQQPIYAAPPRFQGVTDPFADTDRFIRLDAAVAVRVLPPANTDAQIAAALVGLNEHHVAGSAITSGGRNQVLTSIAGSMRARGLEPPSILAALRAHNETHCVPPLPDRELETIARSVGNYEPSAVPVVAPPAAAGNLAAMKALARQSALLIDDPGLLPTAATSLKALTLNGELTIKQVVTRFLAALSKGAEQRSETQPITAGYIEGVLSQAPALADAARPAWQTELLTDAEGHVRIGPENLRIILESHPQFSSWFDTRAQVIEWERAPWRQAGPLKDEDSTWLRCWLDREMGWPKLPQDPFEVIRLVAKRREWDPWVGYLEALRWDGTPRLTSAALTLLGACERAEWMCFAWWMVSAVARSFNPGCQVDHMIILEGNQGLGKSSFLLELAGSSRYYARASGAADLSNPRSTARLQGPVIIELAELAAIAKRDVEATKEFIDNREDKWIPPYGRAQIASPRRCVFAGTTNQSEYLQDVTGNRRFWPIACIGDIDLAGTRASRDQLWAEAVHAYRAGSQWWPTREQAADLGLGQQVEARRAVSGIEEELTELLARVFVAGQRDPLRPSMPPAGAWQLSADGTLAAAKFNWLRDVLGGDRRDNNQLSNALRAQGWILRRSAKDRIWCKP